MYFLSLPMKILLGKGTPHSFIGFMQVTAKCNAVETFQNSIIPAW